MPIVDHPKAPTVRNNGNSLVLWLIFLALPGSVAVLHGLFPLVVVLLIGIVLYIPFAMVFDAIRKAMWRHKHRAQPSVIGATTLEDTTTMNRPRRGRSGTVLAMCRTKGKDPALSTATRLTPSTATLVDEPDHGSASAAAIAAARPGHGPR
jgi:hypothetical protein